MELTQRLQPQQTLGDTCLEQIGFLGICGNKYPVVKGPNKIGRDPQTCNIVLNLNSVSRQHAVLNVLSKNNYMLMDLDSANKTRLQDKTLEPYIAVALKDGDTVQFGQIFGIFRLLEEETNLPMTQAMEIPETPVMRKHVSRINHTAIIPESPEMSDRDDSFITPSQPKPHKNSINNFIKQSGKSVFIQPVGQTGIDNVYWNSSKKSDSFQFDSGLINVQIVNVKSEPSYQNDIHELDTQVTLKDHMKDNISIYEANTQLSYEDKLNYSNTIKTAAINYNKDVNNADVSDKCNDQYKSSALVLEVNKIIPDEIYDMETQVHAADILPNVCKMETSANTHADNDLSIFDAETQQIFIEPKTENVTVIEKCNSHDESDDVILFDEIDSQPMDDNESQAILPPSPVLFLNNDLHKSNIVDGIKSNNPINTNIATDCDDFYILPTQIITAEDNGDTDKQIDKPQINVAEPTNNITDEDVTDYEDNLDRETGKQTKFEDLQTQIIPEEPGRDVASDANNSFGEMLTQVIVPENDTILKSKVLSQINTVKDSFKVPKPSPRKVIKKTNLIESLNKRNPVKNVVSENDEFNFYAATQDILDDLCTQRDLKEINDSDFKTSGLSSQNVRDIIGVETNLKLKRFPSDSSDCDSTPTKAFKFTSTDLPSSQEIKTSVTAQRTIDATFSSDSDTDNDEKNEKDGTPILFKRKKPSEAKRELRKFDVDSLPSRVSTRVRKPTTKIMKNSNSFLKSSFVTEENIDSDIVTENLLRLKSEKRKSDTSKLIESDVHPKREKRAKKEPKKETINRSKDDRDEQKKTENPIPAKRGRPKKQIVSDTGDSIRETRRGKAKDYPTETRRSVRQMCMKDCDESEVYSTDNSPLRRGGTTLDLPAEKHSPATSLGLVTSSRAVSARRQKTHHVLFTAFPVDEVKSQLESLGAVIVKDVKACTVVITLQIKRTFKLLCAVGLGKPIVGRQWVQACVDNNAIVDPWHYLIQDEATEQRFNFKLERTLRSKRSFLKGTYVSTTPSVMPNAQEMKLIVESSGGKWREAPSTSKSKWLVVSSPADKALWPAIKKKGGIVVSNELILSGVLRQTLNIEKNRLD